MDLDALLGILKDIATDAPELMEAAKNGYERIVTCVENLKFLEGKAGAGELSDGEKGLLEEAKGFVAKFDEAMDDDFNTADAIAAIFELVKFANSHADEKSSKAFLQGLREELVMLSDICGLIVERKEDGVSEEVLKLVEERTAAKKAKDFARADSIREELLSKGYVLKDTREGVKIERA